jgi:hypothetical protein
MSLRSQVARFTLAWLFLFATFAIAQATVISSVTVSSMVVENWRYGGTTAKLRVYASDTFDQSGNFVVASRRGSGQWYKQIDCTISGTSLTIPSFSVYVTTTSSVPTAVYTFVWVDSRGAERDVFRSEIAVPDSFGATITWSQLNTYNAGRPLPRNPTYLNSDQVAAMIATGGSSTAGGDLGGSYPNPTVAQARGLRETAGPTTLVMGTVGDGQFLSRSGNTIVGANSALASRTLTAGAGLTGGGDLSSDRSFAVGAGLGITVNADDVALTTPGSLSVSSSNSASGNHTHAITSSANPGAAASLLASQAGSPQLTLPDFLATGNLFVRDVSTGLTSPSTTVISPVSGNSIRSTSYTSGSDGWNVSAGGNADFNNIDVRGSIRSSVFLYNQLQATAGTVGVFKSACKLRSDATVPSSPSYGTTTINIDCVDQDGVSHAASQLFAVSDVLRLKDGLVGDTWFTVSSVSDQTSFWRYVATIRAGSNNVTYKTGAAVADYGQSGAGFIVQCADCANAPYLQMATHAATFSSADASGSLNITPQLRLGNLNGSYGLASDIFGFGTGQYGVSGKSWVVVDPTNGVRIGNNTTTKIQLDASGNASFTGSVTASAGSIGGWTINSTSLTNGEVKIAAGADFNNIAGTGEAWFGKGTSGIGSQYGMLLKGTTAAFANFAAGNSTVGASGRPYLGINDGTRYRVVLGELNTTVWDGVASNSMGMKVWDSSGNKLAEFSDVRNVISGWTIGTSKISSTGIDINSGASAGLAFGSTPPASATSGTGLWMDRTGLYGLSSGTQQAIFDAATGKITAGAGNVALSSDGIVIEAGASAINSINWVDTPDGDITHRSATVSLNRSGSPKNTTFDVAAGMIAAVDTDGFVTSTFSAANNANAGSRFRLTKYGTAHSTKPSQGFASLVATNGVLISTNVSDISTEPATSAILDLSTTTGAVLFPRLTSTQRDALTATNGMVIYNTTTDKLQVRAAGAWVDLH